MGDGSSQISHRSRIPKLLAEFGAGQLSGVFLLTGIDRSQGIVCTATLGGFIGAHSYRAGNATKGSEEAAKFKKSA